MVRLVRGALLMQGTDRLALWLEHTPPATIPGPLTQQKLCHAAHCPITAITLEVSGPLAFRRIVCVVLSRNNEMGDGDNHVVEVKSGA